eukprot:31061-Pelagococcus_subviridis.AAC.6
MSGWSSKASVPEHVGRRHVDDVRRVRLERGALPRLKRRRHLVLGASGDGDRGDLADVEPVRVGRLREVALGEIRGHHEDGRVRAILEVRRESFHRPRDAVDVVPHGAEDDDAAFRAVPFQGVAIPDAVAVQRRDVVLLLLYGGGGGVGARG